VHRLILYMD